MAVYTFHENADPKKNDEFVMASDQNSLFQCSQWADIKQNWKHAFTSVTDENGNICAAALVLTRKLAFGKTICYIPRGPVMDYANAPLVQFTLASLKNYAKTQKAAVLRFDPKLHYRMYPYKARKEEQPTQNTDVIALLKDLGAVHTGFTTYIEESTQPRYNAEMDITPDYFNQLEHKTQKCIRKAENSGLEIESGLAALDDFSTAMHYTEVRKKVALRDEEYYRHMLDVYGDQAIILATKLNFPRQIQALEQELSQPVPENLTKKKAAAAKQQRINAEKELERLKADCEREKKDEVITCGILAVYNQNLMELFYMGNNPDYMRLYSSYLLYNKCLGKAAQLGIRECSFGGIEGTLDDGLTLFKSNFLMNVEEYIGEFNFVFDPFVYKLFQDVYPKVLKAAARTKGKK